MGLGNHTGVSPESPNDADFAAELLPNTTNAYKSLSKYTAEARRAGTFPALIERGHTIHRYTSFDGAPEARKWLAGIYRRDCTEGQNVSIYLGVEKAGIVAQLEEWFGDFGVPMLFHSAATVRRPMSMR